MIDLNDPAHVEALRWACNFCTTCGADLSMSLVDATRPFDHAGKLPRLRHIALQNLVDPASAADLLRRVLERCGVGWFARLYGVVDTSAPLPPFDGEDPYPGTWVALDKMPRIILALLDAPDRAAALAALRGER